MDRSLSKLLSTKTLLVVYQRAENDNKLRGEAYKNMSIRSVC